MESAEEYQNKNERIGSKNKWQEEYHTIPVGQRCCDKSPLWCAVL